MATARTDHARPRIPRGASASTQASTAQLARCGRGTMRGTSSMAMAGTIHAVPSRSQASASATSATVRRAKVKSCAPSAPGKARTSEARMASYSQEVAYQG